MRSSFIDSVIEERGGAPVILGHRGVRKADVTENTLEAFEEAFKRGAQGIEIDVESTADGKLVVVNRWFCKSQFGFFPWEKSADELFDAARVEGFQLPTFHETCRFMKGKENSVFNVEIKSSHRLLCHTARKAMGVIRHHGIDDQVILSSFDINTLLTTRFFHRTIETAYLFRLHDRVVDVEEKNTWRFKFNTWINRSGIKGFLAGVDTLHPELLLIQETGRCNKLWLKAARQLGKRVNVWTVDSPKDLSRAVSTGAMILISDNVTSCVEVS